MGCPELFNERLDKGGGRKIAVERVGVSKSDALRSTFARCSGRKFHKAFS